MDPIERFSGAALEDALCAQFVVNGDRKSAAQFAKVATLIQFATGSTIIHQGHADNSIYFLLFGEVSIMINGREMARRPPNQHVGEMALIDHGAPRSASVVSRTVVVAAEIKEPDFTKIADEHPTIWRRLATELGNRLRQRTAFVRPRNERPLMFLGSSTESLPVVTALVAGLRSAPFIVHQWNLGVFRASQFPIDELIRQLEIVDFAALVLGPDDEVVSRHVASDAPRDNVLLELGFFMGALGRSRTFMILPRHVNIKIPSDLLGLTTIRFSTQQDLVPSLVPVCDELLALVAAQGAR